LLRTFFSRSHTFIPAHAVIAVACTSYAACLTHDVQGVGFSFLINRVLSHVECAMSPSANRGSPRTGKSRLASGRISRLLPQICPILYGQFGVYPTSLQMTRGFPRFFEFGATPVLQMARCSCLSICLFVYYSCLLCSTLWAVTDLYSVTKCSTRRARV
jgi:hypothetical protein